MDTGEQETKRSKQTSTQGETLEAVSSETRRVERAISRLGGGSRGIWVSTTYADVGREAKIEDMDVLQSAIKVLVDRGDLKIDPQGKRVLIYLRAPWQPALNKRAARGSGPAHGRPEETPRSDTKLGKVFQAISRRALLTPDRTVEVTGEELAKETGLSPSTVHDAVFTLAQKGLVKKMRAGARFRSMLLAVPTPAGEEEHDVGDVLIYRCPNCGHGIDLNRARAEQLAQLEAAIKRLRDPWESTPP